ncbi:MerR family transcriptional regulator [Streptomyces sp. NPDC059009]|uniref:MerR family transcriptional regulator n=1 Tax=Streptomyces sp. NPDC059009 TaxID=3346694 RepID=UPI003693B39C
MNGETLYSIGELARRTGLTVKTIRFYADTGIVPPTDRTPAGYRRYDSDAAARIDLVRTLRELGIDLDTIRRVMAREVSLAQVVATQADALDVQIRVLRQRRAVLAAVSRRGSTPQEMDLMHKLGLSEAERQNLTAEFLGAVFDGLHDHPALAAVIRTLTPELPDDPAPEQIEAWVELAVLCQDDDFRAALHGMAREVAAERDRYRAAGGAVAVPRILAEVVRTHATPAVEAGIEPDSPRAEPIVTALATDTAHTPGCPPPPDLRDHYLTLAARLDRMNAPRSDQYLSLLAVINGWEAPQSPAAALAWSAAALRARA